MITFERVTKKFPLGNVALDDVSFQIEDNEFVFLVGPSGAGKTTILKLLLREIAPTSGTVLVDDIDVSAKKFGSLVNLRRKFGMVFQDFKILPEKNVFENVALSLQVVGTPMSQIKQEVKSSLELVNLNDKSKVFPAQLSAGEIQRVAIARAIIGNRNILLADEPTGNLDPKTAWEIVRTFKKLEGRKTIIVATHNTDIVNSMQKRVIVLKNGKLTKDVRKGGYDL